MVVQKPAAKAAVKWHGMLSVPNKMFVLVIQSHIEDHREKTGTMKRLCECRGLNLKRLHSPVIRSFFRMSSLMMSYVTSSEQFTMALRVMFGRQPEKIVQRCERYNFTWRASTLWHHTVPPCHIFYNNLRLASILACKSWFGSAELLLFVVLGQVCVSWPIRGDWVLRRGRGFKETAAKTEFFSQRGDKELQHWTEWENWCVILHSSL